MAAAGSWPGISRHGLLSPVALADLHDLESTPRAELLNAPRRRSIVVCSEKSGSALVRDQKVLSGSKLANSLIDCTEQQWLKMLNSRVFFWLTRDRLFTLMNGREYRNDEHVLITCQTEPLVRAYLPEITLSPMNSGSTQPFAHPRGLATFARLAEYPYEARRRLPDYSAVVELAVERGVPDLVRYAVTAERARIVDTDIKSVEVLYQERPHAPLTCPIP